MAVKPAKPPAAAGTGPKAATINNDIAYTELLPPSLLATVGRSEMLARTKKEGGISGRHASPHKGFSVEFAEHRQYTQGDDLRDLDWRVYGKVDKFYIKQYIEETNLRATIIVDASGSMNYVGEEAAEFEGKQLSKFEYARYLGAALTYLLIRQQDAVGLVTFDHEIRKYIRAASKPSQVRQILQELHATKPGKDTAAAEVFHDIAERISRRGLVIIISDLFDDGAKIKEALHHFQYRNHELVVFHLMAEEELTFPFKKFTNFRNLELFSQNIKVDPLSIKAQYLDRVRRFVDTIEKACGQMKADYVPVNTKIPVTETLSGYLSRRREQTKI